MNKIYNNCEKCGSTYITSIITQFGVYYSCEYCGHKVSRYNAICNYNRQHKDKKASFRFIFKNVLGIIVSLIITMITVGSLIEILPFAFLLYFIFKLSNYKLRRELGEFGDYVEPRK